MGITYSNLLSLTDGILSRWSPIPDTEPAEGAMERRERPSYRLNRGIVRILDDRDDFITCAQVCAVDARGVVLFAFSDQLCENRTVRVAFALPALEITLSGVILFASGDYFAIAFTGLTPEAEKMLDQCFEFEAYFETHANAVLSVPLLSRHPRRADIQQDLQRCAATMEREAQTLRERAEALGIVMYMADKGDIPYWTSSLDLLPEPSTDEGNYDETD